MTTDQILERVLDRLDKVSDGLASLTAQTEAVVERLDKLNGAVARHEKDLGDTKLWQAAHEQRCQARMSDKTAITVSCILAGAAVVISGRDLAGYAQWIVKLLTT